MKGKKMKRNLKTWLVIGASVIAAIAFASAAGILFSRNPVGAEKGGDEILKIIRIIIPSLCLIAIAFIAMAISYFSIYEMGKGRNITPKDLIGSFELLSQWTAPDGKSYATLQDFNFRQRMTSLPVGKIRDIKPGDYVKSWFLNGLWTLVPIKFYLKTSEQKEAEKPVAAKRTTQSLPNPKVFEAKTQPPDKQPQKPPSPSPVVKSDEKEKDKDDKKS